MNKKEFLFALRQQLKGIPKDEIEEHICFYGEMIDDRVEDGISEEDAVLEIGDVETVANQILSDISLSKIIKAKIVSKRKYKAWEILLLVLGSPIWLSLLLALFAVELAVYVSAWAIIISLWAIFVSFIGVAFGGIVSGIMFVLRDNAFSGIAMISVGLFSAGASVMCFFGCKASTKGIVIFTQKTFNSIKTRIIKRRMNDE